MMSDSRLASVLGAPFIHIALTFFISWALINAFVIRPMVGGSLIDSTMQYFSNQNRKAKQNLEQAERNSVKTSRTYTHHLNRKTGELKTSVTTTVTDPLNNRKDVYEYDK